MSRPSIIGAISVTAPGREGICRPDLASSCLTGTAPIISMILSKTTRSFATDSVNAGISPRFLIVEQSPGLSFGALLNVGFQLLAPFLCSFWVAAASRAGIP